MFLLHLEDRTVSGAAPEPLSQEHRFYIGTACLLHLSMSATKCSVVSNHWFVLQPKRQISRASQNWVRPATPDQI